MRLRSALTALPFLVPAAAHAQGDGSGEAGTALGAAALTAALKDYLGPLPFKDGFVTIEPDPKGYRITLAAKGSFSTALPGGGRAETNVSPYSLVVSQRSDGNWQVNGDGAVAFSYGLDVDGGKVDTDYAINGIEFAGIWATDIRSFLTSTGTIDGMQMSQAQPNGDVRAEFGPMRIQSTSQPKQDGIVDYSLSQVVDGFTETIRTALDPAQPDKFIDIVFSAGAYTVTTDAADLQARPITDLAAFLLRKAGDDTLRQSEPELKRLIGEAMPLWSRIAGDTSLDDIAVKTPFGTAAIGRLDLALSGDGIVTDGTYRYRFAASGMTYDFPQIPGWAKPLIPSDMTMDVVGAGIDLETPARIMISRLDLSTDEPLSEEAGREILATFEEKRPRLRLENVRLAARDYDVTVDGEITFDAAKPETRFDIVATGLDAALKSLQDAGAEDPQALQGFAFGSMAKGFGRQIADGKTQWVIETAADGSVKINGVTIKGPDAPSVEPQPSPEIEPAPLAPEGDDGAGQPL
ncbi:DUF2125 domain-containing protein [Jiella pacifica]|uniref:DUF2125 domain-containing protein n=1 Tax=Jiella pacifica TaxID=2696469 RepID=A0A6N9T146_9HYPH|nr:DUF2125 domain-containing protein [Jiella pacifica]NDW05037.1 DUF2125 domain-containing protein [Jiella pacifica]